MISAAVVEDNREFAEMLRERILSGTDWGTEISVVIYGGPEEFLRETEGKEGERRRTDIAFLDVEMPGMSGMELAERIRAGDREMLLVFVSSFSEYAMDGYQVYAFDYLLKSQLDRKWDRLAQRLKKALADTGERWYTVQTRNRTERILIEDILYLYKEEKYVIIVTDRERYAVRKTMQETAEDFRGYTQFIPVKRGIIVNAEKIRRATAKELFLCNGEHIVIGRMYVEKVREQLHACLQNKSRGRAPEVFQKGKRG